MSGMMHSRPFRCSGIRIHMSQSQSWGEETATHTQVWGHDLVAAPLAPACLGCSSLLCGWLRGPQVTVCPKSFLLGLPSQWKLRESQGPSKSCTHRDWAMIRDC